MINTMLLFLLIGIFVSPILKEILNTILLWIEIIKIKPTKIINTWNKELQNDIESDGSTDSNAIGFQYTSNENEENYEDYEDYE